MIIRGQYTISDGGEQSPCPFCGSTDTDLRPGGAYSYNKVYCNGCLTEFTFYPRDSDRLRVKMIDNTLRRWNGRVDPDSERCPLCGCKAIEFDGIMNYSTFFADAYCPDCRVRFEFQRVKKGKSEPNNLRKAKKAFGRRA